MIDQLVILSGFPWWVWALVGLAGGIVLLILYYLGCMILKILSIVIFNFANKFQNDNGKTEHPSGRKGK